MLIIETTNEAQHATLLLCMFPARGLSDFFLPCFTLNDNETHPYLFLLALC